MRDRCEEFLNRVAEQVFQHSTMIGIRDRLYRTGKPPLELALCNRNAAQPRVMIPGGQLTSSVQVLRDEGFVLLPVAPHNKQPEQRWPIRCRHLQPPDWP